jgi:hypothetical protein
VLLVLGGHVRLVRGLSQGRRSGRTAASLVRRGCSPRGPRYAPRAGKRDRRSAWVAWRWPREREQCVPPQPARLWLLAGTGVWVRVISGVRRVGASGCLRCSTRCSGDGAVLPLMSEPVGSALCPGPRRIASIRPAEMGLLMFMGARRRDRRAMTPRADRVAGATHPRRRAVWGRRSHSPGRLDRHRPFRPAALALVGRLRWVVARRRR